MSVAAGPYIVSSGLVFDYDTNNTNRSWKGQPTTNVLPYPDSDWNGTGFVLSYNYPNASATYTYITNIVNPINAPGVLRYYTGTTAYKYWAIQGTVPSPSTYTFSYYARMSDGGPSNITNGQLWRDTGADKAVTGDFNPTFTTEWVRYSTTGPVTSYLDYFPVHSGSILGGYTIDYCGFQLEAGSYATPYVNGIRSNTQAILDLTGNNTVNATSLTYLSDGTFTFTKASANYLTLPLQSTVNTNVSVSCWAYVTLGTAGCIFESGSGSGFSIGIGNTNLTAADPGNNVVGLFPAIRWLSTGVSYGTTGWKNIVVTMDGSSIPTIYLNGSSIGTYPGTAPLTPVTNSFVGRNIGDESSPTDRAFNGAIPSVSFYNRALTAAEVTQNFNAFRGRYGI